ncbi:MAG: WYL domain-containing protein, partial [Verrucomicrobia bacterium]|nr:WYL domain-containing protein [Prolixibacteraceae bacterium]
HLVVSFTYQKYWDEQMTQRLVEPYALKEFRNRWYMLGIDQRDRQVKSFAFDRISELEITNLRFQPSADLDVNEYYKNCFGIISPTDHELAEVILSFDPIQGKYIQSLPLHETQQVLVDNDQEVRIKLTVYLTLDFIMEIRSHGENVMVIQPQSLIDELKQSYKKALTYYTYENN